MFPFGIVIFIFGVFASMGLKGLPMSALANPAAILILLTTLVAVLTATRGFTTFALGLKAAVLPNAALAEEERGRAASLFRLLSKMSVLAALIALIVGVMSALGNMGDVPALRHALSYALAAPLWALILIAAVFEPVVFVMKKRQTGERRSKNGGSAQ